MAVVVNFLQARQGRFKTACGMLAGLECDVKHPLSQVLGVPYKIAVDRAVKTMRITVTLDQAPKKNDVKGMTHYQLQLVVLYPSFSKGRVRKEIAAGDMALFSDKPGRW